MKEYDSLKQYLLGQRGGFCTLKFSDIEEIIGASLPSSARNHAQWWGNDKTHTQALSWMLAGWNVERSNLSEEYVFFTRGLSNGAKRKGHSLQRELKNILTKRRELITEADRIRAMTAGPLENSVSILREGRDS